MKLKTIALSLVLSLPLSGAAQEQVSDAKILQAREAAKANDKARLIRLTSEAEGHELAPWVEYWALRTNIESSDPEAIRRFLQRYDVSYPAEKMRMDWLRLLGKQGRWEEFKPEFAKLRAPEQDVTCYNWQARWQQRDASVLDEVVPLWLGLPDAPEACRPVLEALIWEKRALADNVWQRIRRQVEANRLGSARSTMVYLPPSQTPDPRELDLLVDRPIIAVVSWANQSSLSKAQRELAALAISRLARGNPTQAAQQFARLEAMLEPSQKQWVWGQLGWQAATRHLPEALSYYKQSGANYEHSDDVQQWHVRAALRAGDWAEVQQSIEQMSPQLAALPDWTYWLGRAYKANGRLEQANALFLRIAGQANFYGNLADEELGKTISVPTQATPSNRDELEKAISTPGLRRALNLIRLEMRTEGVAEWNWTLRGMNDRELLAAADIARLQRVFDRAISAADRTKNEHDYSLRYLAPYAEQVRPAAQNQGVDDAWVYGLMRQESRFITSARSNVGASGLMQLMPATARWVAKQVGLRNFSQSQVNDIETNVLLGTTYMRLVLESLDKHPVLASAAYNAGPGRARQWKGDRPLEGAIYAETIPFSETRDYVKKVMSNAVFYSVLFNGRAESLKNRLGVITAKNPQEAQKPEELP